MPSLQAGAEVTVRLDISHVSMIPAEMDSPPPIMVVHSDRFGSLGLSAAGIDFSGQPDVRFVAAVERPVREVGLHSDLRGATQLGTLEFDYPESERLNLRLAVLTGDAAQKFRLSPNERSAMSRDARLGWMTARAAGLGALHSVLEPGLAIVHLLHRWIGKRGGATSFRAANAPCELQCAENGPVTQGPGCVTCQSSWGDFLLCCH
jgi:hypothetical protein